MPNYNAFERTCAEAVGCNRCFPKMAVARASVDLAQPRYVGPGYWTATERRLFLMINPGAGSNSPSDQALRQDIVAYRNRDIDLEQLFERQRKHFPEWGRGKFLSFLENLGGPLDGVALLNVAWCSTQGDRYPPAMLQTCFEAYTKRALEALQPTVIIACGRPAQKLARRAGLPFVPAPHPAARFNIDYDALRRMGLEFARTFGAIALEAFISALDEHSGAETSRGSSRKSHFSDGDTIRLLARYNPKTGKGALRFDCYCNGMTVAEYRAEVTRRLGSSEARKCLADLRWDESRNFIQIEKR